MPLTTLIDRVYQFLYLAVFHALGGLLLHHTYKCFGHDKNLSKNFIEVCPDASLISRLTHVADTLFC